MPSNIKIIHTHMHARLKNAPAPGVGRGRPKITRERQVVRGVGIPKYQRTPSLRGGTRGSVSVHSRVSCSRVSVHTRVSCTRVCLGAHLPLVEPPRFSPGPSMPGKHPHALIDLHNSHLHVTHSIYKETNAFLFSLSRRVFPRVYRFTPIDTWSRKRAESGGLEKPFINPAYFFCYVARTGLHLINIL